MAVDPSGNATTVWSQFDGIRYSVWSNRCTPGGGWGTAVLIETDVGYGAYPQVAVDPSGNATAVWEQSDRIVYDLHNIWSNRFE